MLRDLRIPLKFPLFMICFALLSAIIMGIIANSQASRTMRDQAENKLEALRDSRAATLAQHFDQIEADVRVYAQSHLAIAALRDFARAWDQLGADPTTYLQGQYIDSNPYAFGQKQNLLNAQDGTDYSRVHESTHITFTTLSGMKQFYDVFLIDRDGNIVYTVAKERDFATNVRTNPETRVLGALFDQVQQTDRQLRTVFSDFHAYAPSNEQVAGFVMAPVVDENGTRLGALAVQVAIDRINEIMQITAGMGDSGETYVVGPDKLMRSASRFLTGRNVLTTVADTPAVQAALMGRSGVQVVQDYRGVPVFSAYRPVEIMGTTWALLAEIDEDEMLAPVRALSTLLSISGGALAVAIAVLGYLLASDLSRPIVSMTSVMSRLARNDLKVNIAVGERKDEIGVMARALADFKDFFIEREELRARLERMAEIDSLTDLANRNHAVNILNARIAQDGSHAQAITVMFVDLDGFKQINDRFGHLVGDQVLREMGARLSSALDQDDVIARMGGDEFCVILSGERTKADAERIARQLLQAARHSAPLGIEDMTVGLSIGIARFPEDARDVTGLLRAADRAMYKAKARGKGGFAWSDVTADVA